MAHTPHNDFAKPLDNAFALASRASFITIGSRAAQSLALAGALNAVGAVGNQVAAHPEASAYASKLAAAKAGLSELAQASSPEVGPYNQVRPKSEATAHFEKPLTAAVKPASKRFANIMKPPAPGGFA